MLAKLNTFALVGIDALAVEAEVDTAPGLPKTVLVGLPEMSVKESVHRIERALANLGYQRHTGRTVINLASTGIEEVSSKLNTYDVDFTDVRGQESAKRALVVAASGGHNVLMIGSPGTGKSMLARRLPTILPPLTQQESLETTRIYSAMGRLGPDEPLLPQRPYRSPHHTISDAGM